MSESSSVLYEVQQSVATITLNRPESLNAMTNGLMKDLVDALARVEADKSVRVVVITGSGRGFCAGADLAGQASAKPSDPKPDGKVDDHFNGAI
jgi:enoyl-CoA hydratase/carnithine racemase